jgi:hypothetical protein
MIFLCILIIIVLILVILVILEIVMLFLVRHPRVLRFFSHKLQNSISYLYVQSERKIMQFQEGCGQYHPELGYTLKPGRFIFSGEEFSNSYFINSLGVRDREEALIRPEIVIVGDSFALGWGVEQDETFAKLLEQKTKLKTLNTSVPSYGTVREMIMLRRVDISNLKCLIIQYCGDDYDENLKFYLNDNRPQIMRAETFANLTKQHSQIKKYYMGKYLLMKIKKRIKEWKSLPPEKLDQMQLSDVDLFIHVLKQNENMLRSLPIIIFEINGINQTNFFSTTLKQKLCNVSNPPFIQALNVLDMSQHLSDEDFYVLDDHLTVTGNTKVADVLYRKMKGMNII